MSDASETRRRMRAELSWLPGPLFRVYYDEWVRSGDANLAVWAMRQSDEYDQFFGGNRRDDGSLRWTEQEYLQITEDYEDSLRNIAGVNPNLFKHRFADLISGNKSPDEFATQIAALTERVTLDAPEVLTLYSEYWGIDATVEGLVGMALDPQVNDLVLNRQMTMAEIGAEGRQRGFSIAKEFAASLYNADLDEQAAADFFGDAGNWVPVLNVLARRHADPNDEFDLEEFSQAEIFQDPLARKRMSRLVAQERAGFQVPATFGARTDTATGGLSGLAPR